MDISKNGYLKNWISQKIPNFANIPYFWSLTMSICRSRAPEFKSGKSGIGTKPNRPNRDRTYGIRGSKLPNYKLENMGKHDKL